MKKIILFLFSIVLTFSAIAQTTVLFVSVQNDLSLFTRPMPVQSIVLNIADNKLYRLSAAAPVNSSLSTSQKVKLTSEETDPIWLIDKPNYASIAWVNSQNFLKNFTELDPIWNAAKNNYITYVNEPDRIWTAEKTYYAQKTWVEDKHYLITESDPFWLIDKPNFATKEYVDSKSSGIELLYTSTNTNYVLVDSVFIVNNSIINIESVVLSMNSNSQISTWKHRISFTRINNVIVMMPNVLSILDRNEYLSLFEFSPNNSNGYLRFRVKSSTINQKWKISYTFKNITL